MTVVFASKALSVTLTLIAVFGGIGLLVHGLIGYVVALVLAERKQNRQNRLHEHR